MNNSTGQVAEWLMANGTIASGIILPLGASGATASTGPSVVTAGATQEIDTPSAAMVEFSGATGTLALDASSSFTGTVSGFGGQNTLDLRDIGFGANAVVGYSPNADNSRGNLTVSDGTNVAKIALLGQYVAAGFNAAPDSGTGTVITYTSPSGQTSETLLSTPQHI